MVAKNTVEEFLVVCYERFEPLRLSYIPPLFFCPLSDCFGLFAVSNAENPR